MEEDIPMMMDHQIMSSSRAGDCWGLLNPTKGCRLFDVLATKIEEADLHTPTTVFVVACASGEKVRNIGYY